MNKWIIIGIAIAIIVLIIGIGLYYGLSGSAVSSTSTYQMYAATNYPEQGDIPNGVILGNGTTCQQACDNATNCTGFVTDETNCWLKDATVKIRTSDPKLTYYYKGTPPLTSPYQTYAATNYPNQGDIVGGVIAGDAITCQAECDKVADCSGFVTDGTSCWLKNNTVKTMTYDKALNYYYKGTPPPGPAKAP